MLAAVLTPATRQAQRPGRAAVHVRMVGAAHTPLLVLLVGVPGSGKSTFVQELLANVPASAQWSRISQDALGTRKKCFRAANDALEQGRHVIIDRCNFDAEQRAHWLRLPQLPKGGARAAVFLDVPQNVAYDRVLARPAHEGGVDSLSMSPSKMRSIIRSMASKLCVPDEAEGITHIYRCRDDAARRAAVESLLKLAAAQATLDAG